MNATRITLAAALAVSLAACSAGSPTAPAHHAARRRADTTPDSVPPDTIRPPHTTSTDPAPVEPPPPGDGKSPLFGTGA